MDFLFSPIPFLLPPDFQTFKIHNLPSGCPLPDPVRCAEPTTSAPDSAQLLFPLGIILLPPVLPLPQTTEKEEAEPEGQLKTGSGWAQVSVCGGRNQESVQGKQP